MKKNILFLISGIVAGIALCLFGAYHLPVSEDEFDWLGHL